MRKHIYSTVKTSTVHHTPFMVETSNNNLYGLYLEHINVLLNFEEEDANVVRQTLRL